MEKSEQGKRVIEASFKTIGGVRSFTTFSRLTPEESECRRQLAEIFDDITQIRSREQHLSTLVVCIADCGDDDQDEPITEGSFSQYRFFATYVHDLVFHLDKFDFLLHCIVQGVCKVRRASRFKKLLMRVLEAGLERERYRSLDNRTEAGGIPDEVLNYDALLELDEEHRVDSFTLRKDWVCRVPPLPALAAAYARGNVEPSSAANGIPQIIDKQRRAADDDDP